MAKRPSTNSWLKKLDDVAASQAKSFLKIFTKEGRSEPRARYLAKTHAKADVSEYRKLSPEELEKAGFSKKAERYVLAKGGNRITDKTVTISKHQFLTKRTSEKVGERISLETAAVLRKNEELAYANAEAESQAEKQRQTRLRQTLEKRVSALQSVTDYKGYKPNTRLSSDYLAIRDRKLGGEFFEDGDYFALLDLAAAIKDPALPMLKNSPDVLRYA